MERHIPVLLDTVIEYLELKPNDNVVDATLGAGGYTKKLLAAVAPYGTVLGIDQDKAMTVYSAEQFADEIKMKRLIIRCDNFRSMQSIVQEASFGPVHAIVFDLGVARWHFARSKRGFSFQDPHEQLSMRLGNDPTIHDAAWIVNHASSEELADILYTFGEEPRARMFARRIVEARKKHPIQTVGDFLVALGMQTQSFQRRHPATRIFQALRIAVNDELDALHDGLSAAWEILSSGGRIAVVSYHSLEDRIVKKFFRKAADAKHALLVTKKVVKPLYEEIKKNSSARSAKLRVIQKI